MYGDTLGLIIEAPSPADAKVSAADMITRQIDHDRDFIKWEFSKEPILCVNTEAGQSRIREIWASQDRAYRQALIKVWTACADKTMIEENHGHLEDLLEDIDFRRACAQLGTLTMYPVLLYDPVGLGVTTKSYLDNLLVGVPFKGKTLYPMDQLWLVLVEIRE